MVPAKKNHFRHFLKFRVLSVRPLILAQASVSTLNGQYGPFGFFWRNLRHWMDSQVFTVIGANFLAKKPDFGVTAAIKQQRRLCRIWGRAALVAVGRMRLRHYYSDNGGGGERRRRTIWGIRRRWIRWEKQAASVWSSVRYCACLPILFSPFSFYPLICGFSRKYTMRLQVLGWHCTELTPTWLRLQKCGVQWGIMEQAQFWGVNKKLTWTKMQMGALNTSLVFGEIMSALK